MYQCIIHRFMLKGTAHFWPNLFHSDISPKPMNMQPFPWDCTSTYILRRFQHPCGTYPGPWITCLWKESFHILTFGISGVWSWGLLEFSWMHVISYHIMLHCIILYNVHCIISYYCITVHYCFILFCFVVLHYIIYHTIRIHCMYICIQYIPSDIFRGIFSGSFILRHLRAKQLRKKPEAVAPWFNERVKSSEIGIVMDLSLTQSLNLCDSLVRWSWCLPEETLSIRCYLISGSWRLFTHGFGQISLLSCCPECWDLMWMGFDVFGSKKLPALETQPIVLWGPRYKAMNVTIQFLIEVSSACAFVT